jgi:hypothetical protein
MFKAEIIADGKIIAEVLNKDEVDEIVERAYFVDGYNEVFTRIIEGVIE